MKIVVAPDKFKGTLTAPQGAEAIGKGILKAARKYCRTNISIISAPMADGGEGSVAALLGKDEECREVSSFDALMRPVKSYFGFQAVGGKRRAIVEASASIGLYRLTKWERNPAIATSFGVGIDIAAAIEAGCEEIIVALGGTATSDCGAGMLAALGCRFYDFAGNLVTNPCGADLGRIQRIDYQELEKRTKGIEFIVLRDVDNPLLGDNGAAASFSPQKGADEATVALLEEGALHFSRLASHATGRDYATDAGSGAAGGIGWALRTFCGAESVRGAEFIGTAIGLKERIRGASLVVTGEGRFDTQSLNGKVAGYVASLAASEGIPVIVLCGIRDKAIPNGLLLESGVAGVYALTDRVSPQEAFARPAYELERMSEDIFGYLFS